MATRRIIHTLCIHHSASSSGSVAEFRREHIARGFGDVGYHSVILNGHGGPDGRCDQGRPDSVKGCGVWGNNTGLLHVCLVGQFARSASGYTPATTAQLGTLGEWLQHRSKTYGALRIVGHKEIALPSHQTLCPGDLPLDKIRQWLACGSPNSLAAFLEAP
jgi:N-acetylmuramoyl-L-alanine amidase